MGHTPGPWFATVEDCGPWGKQLTVVDDYDTPHDIIRQADMGCVRDAEANAALIAAAPDLLAALKKLLEAKKHADTQKYDEHCDQLAWEIIAKADWQSALDAIAKAEGANSSAIPNS
jgi:hypothetical protein